MSEITPIVRMRFGSHLYGTNTPASDEDFKSVHLPASRDILLQRAQAVVTLKRTKLDPTARNTAGDVDDESLALHQFLKLAGEGQTMAMDMLFAPESAWISHTHLWRIVLANRPYMLSRRPAAFVGYCKAQANKYGIKGSRMAAAGLAVEVLSTALEMFPNDKLGEIEGTLRREFMGVEHIDFVERRAQPDRPAIMHLDVCGKLAPFTGSIRSAHDCYKRLFDEYGLRARQAEANEGIDWKALSHAVRVAAEAQELLRFGTIAFPRPEADLLIMIKAGQVPYAQVAELIERSLDDVLSLAEQSTLPEKPNLEAIDDLLHYAYGAHVAQSF